VPAFDASACGVPVLVVLGEASGVEGASVPDVAPESPVFGSWVLLSLTAVLFSSGGLPAPLQVSSGERVVSNLVRTFCGPPAGQCEATCSP
jgi:hypothetical protein